MISGLVQFHPDLDRLMVPVDEITQHPENYNGGDVEKISESIEINGMYRPLYVQRSTKMIISGNHTYEACLSLGATEVPVVWVDCDDSTARRIMVADNRIASLAQPDNALLLPLLKKMQDDGGLIGSGYQPFDIEALEQLAKMPLEYDDFAQWPTLTFQVPPHVRKAFLVMTETAVGDRERFELLLRLAGWDGKPIKA